MNEIKVQFKHTFPDNMCGAVQSKVRLVLAAIAMS